MKQLMPWWLQIVGVVLFAISSLITLSTRLGNASPENPLLALFRPDSECRQPCWHSIQPGHTSVVDANAILAADSGLITNIMRHTDVGDYITWDIPRFSIISAYLLYGRSGSAVQAVSFGLPTFPIFRLGDAIALWGTPTNGLVYMCAGADAGHAMADVRFNGNIEVRTVEFFNTWERASTPKSVQLTPETPLQVVRYYADSFQFTWDWANLPKWTGFKTWSVSEFAIAGMCDL